MDDNNNYNLSELGLDDYEENELVLETVYDLVLFFKQASYTCRNTSKNKEIINCYEKVGFRRFFERHIQLKALDKHELELHIKSQLMVFEISNEKNNESTQKHSYRYNY